MFSSYLAPIGVVTFLTLSQRVLADALFTGCYKNDGTFFTTQADDPDTSLECSTYCGADGYTYSGWQQSSLTCYCSNGYPAGYYITTGTDAGCTDTTQLSVRVTKTSFQNLGCRNSVTYQNDGYSASTVFDVGTCLQSCSEGFIATFRGTGGSNTYTCHCSQGGLASVGDSVTCGAGTYFTFYHSADAQASGLSRRRARESKELQARRQRREVEYCPYGLTACNVGGYSNNYECLDLSTELESCGGCMHGQYGNSSATAGQDCTASGAALGASTCVNGKCVASACKKGLRLIDGTCQ
ncbi:hypothetical protein V865_002829 [Kwoniella europaea PYCC6329]|uniref:Protein CPL1-like domain-containing protein n=1 Tax=Kwoniella europaea PYCC6329 TaxID=1423913 RepID=A0AAX4KG51_9TREE